MVKRRLRRGSSVAAIVLVSMAFAQSPAVAATDPEVWIGAPYVGNWTQGAGCPAAFPSYGCSEPQYHSVDYAAFDGTPLARSWSVDVGNVAVGTKVQFYAAPQVGGTPVTTRIDKVGNACAPGHGSAGSVVVVGVYSGATKIGTVAYAHVNPTVTPGQVINRWGTVIGTVGGGYVQSGCWTGTHTHIEMGGMHNYSCFNKGYHPGPGNAWGTAFQPSNFIGFIGGGRTASSRQACP